MLASTLATVFYNFIKDNLRILVSSNTESLQTLTLSEKCKTLGVSFICIV